MITALRQKVTVKTGGLVSLRSRKLKVGTTAEVIVLVEPNEKIVAKKSMTAAALLKSGLVGIWANRKDMGDSLEFAHNIRKHAEHRDNQK
jgi:hypothetical protein